MHVKWRLNVARLQESKPATAKYGTLEVAIAIATARHRVVHFEGGTQASVETDIIGSLSMCLLTAAS
jgi:hypothetical protein